MAEQHRFEEPGGVEDNRRCERGIHDEELGPGGHDDHGFGIGEGGGERIVKGDLAGESGWEGVGLRVKGVDFRALGVEPLGGFDGGGAAEGVGAGFVREAEDGDAAADERGEDPGDAAREPGFVKLVAGKDAFDEGNADAGLGGEGAEKGDIAGEGAAGKRAAGMEVGLGSMRCSDFRPRSTSRASAPESRDLVDEADGGGEEGVDGVLGHLGGFDGHPFEAVGDGGEDGGEDVAGGLVADADDEAVGLEEDADGFTEAEVFRRAGVVEIGAIGGGGEAGDEANGHLGADEEDCAGSHRGDGAEGAVLDELGVGAVGFVDGGVVGDPDEVDVGGLGKVGREAQSAGGELGGGEIR